VHCLPGYCIPSCYVQMYLGTKQEPPNGWVLDMCPSPAACLPAYYVSHLLVLTIVQHRLSADFHCINRVPSHRLRGYEAGVQALCCKQQ
jgi:hypothetical protein